MSEMIGLPCLCSDWDMCGGGGLASKRALPPYNSLFLGVELRHARVRRARASGLRAELLPSEQRDASALC